MRAHTERLTPESQFGRDEARPSIETAAGCWHNPEHYLKDILMRLPDQPMNCLDELLPVHWRPQQEGMETGVMVRKGT